MKSHASDIPLLDNDEHYELMQRQVNHGCIFLAIFFMLIYLVFVMFFWMIGGITHRSTKNLTGLHDAQSAEDIRDELVTRFGRFDFGGAAQRAREAAAQKANEVKDQTIDAATQAATEAATQAATEAAANAAATVTPAQPVDQPAQ
ncbi:MAG: hypothetical protein Q7S64_02350 [bacterium]|nr:hypothetical protein [bacterium]